MNTQTNVLVPFEFDGIRALVSPSDHGIMKWIDEGITINSKCWIAPGKPNKRGYVKLRIPNYHKIGYVHRFTAFHFCGLKLDGDEEVHHLCGKNKGCCRPSHLQPLSLANHRKQSREDKEHPRGDQTSWSILTEAQVLDCRGRYSAGEKCPTLAKEFKVNRVAMWNALSGVTFAHVDNPVTNIKFRRDCSGENCNKTKLTEAQAIAVFALYWEGDMNTVELGEFYGVNDETIRAIVRSKTWKEETKGLKIQINRVGVSKRHFKVINPPVPSSNSARSESSQDSNAGSSPAGTTI